MKANLDKQFQYYLAHQDEIVEKYNGKWVVIKDDAVVDAYDTKEEAYWESPAKYNVGTFMIMHCTPGDEAYTIRCLNRYLHFPKAEYHAV